MWFLRKRNVYVIIVKKYTFIQSATAFSCPASLFIATWNKINKRRHLSNLLMLLWSKKFFHFLEKNFWNKMHKLNSCVSCSLIMFLIWTCKVLMTYFRYDSLAPRRHLVDHFTVLRRVKTRTLDFITWV